MENKIGNYISQKRKELGYTQQNLAEKLSISFQAVSRWENGVAMPDISLLPKLAEVLETTVDALLGYTPGLKTEYEKYYNAEEYYWGVVPNSMCYDIMRLKPPVKPYHVLDMGCGEGKDAVFLAKNGYRVTAFDLAEAGLEKGIELAKNNNVHVDFFKADILECKLDMTFDIVYSSGVFHYLPLNRRKDIIDWIKKHTASNGIHAINVFVKKPFIDEAPDLEEAEKNAGPWFSGELFTYYHDWLFHKNEEFIFDCSSSGIPHKHCMDMLIAEKIKK